MASSKKPMRKADTVSRAKYTIKRAPGAHLTAWDREKLARAWNAYVRNLIPISIRRFAALHGLPYETWRRELKRGATGPIVRRNGRLEYPEYDPERAEASVAEGRANMGTRMKLTAEMAALFRRHVLEGRRSPYDAMALIRAALPGADVPCLRTFYNHVETGDTGVRRGDTPYHPGRRRRPKAPPHPARTAPGRRALDDRPAEAEAASEPGHLEMDTVVSGVGGRGGLLVLVDRCTRLCSVERIRHVTQEEVLAALRRMRRRGALGRVRSVTTDNGCEFLDQRRLDRLFRADTFYTRAYAAWEKGRVENCNRLVRRWYPKGTDFSRVTPARVRELEGWINSVHRMSLGGATAYEYHSRLAASP